MVPHSNPAAARYALRLIEKGFDIHYLARQMGLTTAEAEEDIEWAEEERIKEYEQKK